MHKPFLISGALFGLLSIVLGAFGAHSLKEIITDEKLLQSFQTGAQYQMYHALALLATGILYEKFPNKLLRWAGNFFISGIIMFSGSLYALAALNGNYQNVARFLGPITPIGGALFISGWICLLIVFVNKKQSKR
ncbi:MAG: DUF423 domain-containing protein [Bacteroidetes bacterium]|nr:DUF423 domain-containing protein [Bacteroidota bacterium]MBS1632612.1 DUF423 domain-containing protein [Bacteroidota bacterium]